MVAVDILENVKLRYSTDDKPGYSRKKVGEKFHYFDTNGKRITDKNTIERINKLAIPPAYKNVWINPHANGHLQATGIDVKKRKQYRYHPLWNKATSEEKFSHVIDFANTLPMIRHTIKEHLQIPGMTRKKVVAAVVWLLENTLIRVGNEEYEKENKSYGLTTLKNRHAKIGKKHRIMFQFKGKSGVYHTVSIRNKKVANIIRRCREIPGQDLFRYYDAEKNIQTISSQDVNSYLQEITGSDITAKDFRTWGGTLLAATAFDKCEILENEEACKKVVSETVTKVALHLRNKPDTCRKYYIHPHIIEAYSQGFILSNLRQKVRKRVHRKVSGLSDYENKVLFMLKHMANFVKTT